MTDYTEREVRAIAELASECMLGEESTLVAGEMLNQLADMLAEREKAEPVAWLYVDAANEPASTQFQPSSDYNIPLYTHPAAQPRVADVDAMVQRFLSWRLPKPWNPDNGISYARPNYAHAPAEHDWPTGTNLFDADQARAMIEHMLAAQESGR